jgi:predicted P-loop ATPase
MANWKNDLGRHKDGTLKKSESNLVLILLNDPRLAGCLVLSFALNKPKVVKPLPWEKPDGWQPYTWKRFRNTAPLKNWLSKKYGVDFNPVMVADAVRAAASEHPVNEFFRSDLAEKFPNIPGFDAALDFVPTKQRHGSFKDPKF